METTRHFTVTTYIVFQNKVLLHMHHKLHLWLPVGGHIDRDELPHDAALREAFEESGLSVKLFPEQSERKFDQGLVRELTQPMALMVQQIQPGHEHIDFAFCALADHDTIIPEAGKMNHESYRWCAWEDIQTMDLKGNVKYCAEKALTLAQEFTNRKSV